MPFGRRARKSEENIKRRPKSFILEVLGSSSMDIGFYLLSSIFPC